MACTILTQPGVIMTASAMSVDAATAPGSPVHRSYGSPTIVRPGGGKAVRAFGNEIQFKLTTELTGGTLSLGLATVSPGKSPPPHTHHREEELFIILEGRYRFFVDNEWIEDVGPGSVVYLPRGCTHTFEMVGDTPGRHWTLQTPSGFERYFERAGEMLSQSGGPDFGKLAALSAEFGYSFSRPNE
jgi:mannose-6-phosphate isomerase-like protein (cupin superfamily)